MLVISDAWHPFWKAEMNGNAIPVIKVNEIFKGIILPSGKGEVKVYFDTSKYFFGVYISIISWIILIIFIFYLVPSKKK